MGVLSIGRKYYSTIFSASQESRCIQFLKDITGTGLNYQHTLTVNAQPSSGDSFYINGQMFTFVSSTPTSVFEIQIGATTSDTASNIRNCLQGCYLFPVYQYNFQYFGGTDISWSSYLIGEKFNRDISLTLAPTLSESGYQSGEDRTYNLGYKVVLDILVNSKFFGKIDIEPQLKFYAKSNSFENYLNTDINAILKDAVYTPDPILGSSDIFRVDEVCKKVTLKYYEIYDGYNGYEDSNYVESEEGWVLNSRGREVSILDILQDKDHNNLEDEYYPNPIGYANLPVKNFLERPTDSGVYDVCAGDPFYIGWFIPEFYGSKAYNELQIEKPNAAIESVSMSTFYTTEGFYMVNAAKFAQSKGVTSGTYYISLNYDPSLGSSSEVYKPPITEPIGIRANALCDWECSCHNTFLFLNRFGVYETFTTTCDIKKDRDMFQFVSEQCVGCNDKDIQSVFTNQYQKTRKITSSGYSEKVTIFKTIPNTKEYINYLKSFLYSSKVFKVSDDGNSLKSVKINTKTRTLNISGTRVLVRIQYEEFPYIRSVER